MIDRLKLSAPLNCSLNVTGRCNLKCLHCSAGSDASYAYDMTLAQLRGVIEAIERAGIIKVHISGGEPLFHKDIFEILSFLKEKEIPITLFTNATLVTPEIAKRLVSDALILSISTSLDGANARSHDALRGKGAFERGLRGIRLLSKADFKIHATCMISKLNMNELAQIAQLAEDLGITISLGHVTLVGRAQENRELFTFTKSEMDTIFDTVKWLSTQFNCVKGGAALEWPRRKADVAQGIKTQTKPGQQLAHCSICKESVSIRPDGWMVPCNTFWDYEIGNVLTTDIREIYRSEKAQKIRDLSGHTSDELDGCSDCLYTGICSGGCRACAYMSSKSLTGIDEFRCIKRYLRIDETAPCLS